MRMRAQVPQPRPGTSFTPMAMRVTTPVMMVMAVTAAAALRLGHACQHATARPLPHLNNNQPSAPAQGAHRREAVPARLPGRRVARAPGGAVTDGGSRSWPSLGAGAERA